MVFFLYTFLVIAVFSFLLGFVLTLLHDGACCFDMGTGLWCLSVGVPLG